MVFYKTSKDEFLFMLLNMESREDFSLWDNTNKRFIRQLPDVQNISDLRFMKQDLFKQRYPNLQKDMQYIRHIAVLENNQWIEYDIGIKDKWGYIDPFKINPSTGKGIFVSVENQIKTFIANCKMSNTNPLDVQLRFRIVQNGQRKDRTITALETIGQQTAAIHPQIQAIPQQTIQNPITPQIMHNLSPNKPTEALQQGFVLPKVNVTREPTQQEMQVIQWANEYKDNLTEEQFIEGFNHSLKKNFNIVTEENLIKEWYKKYYENARTKNP